MKYISLSLFTVSAVFFSGCDADDSLVSPSGDVSVSLSLDADGSPEYSVSFHGTQVIEPSALGIIIDGVDLSSGISVGKPKRSKVDEHYETRGNDTTARNHYQAYTFPVEHIASGTDYTLEFRLYDDGAAYRYIVPGEGVQHVDGERSSWKIVEGAKTWYFERLTPGWKLKSYAGEWLSTDIKDLHTATPARIGPVQGTPLVFELPSALGYAAVTKAATYNYSGMRLEAVGDRTVVANFTEGEEGFDVEGTITTPWRVTMLASNLNELVNSDLINNLNPAPDPELYSDTSYIKPGRSAWSWEPIGLGTPDDQREFIDLAAEMGFEYSTIDDGWKDWENPWETMQTLCEYGQSKGVGVWLWLHSNEVDDPTNDYQEMREYFDKVVAAGSVGMKIDFMNGETKRLVDFEIAVLKNAAKRKLLINFHGCHSSTGEERTYPNELTREGIRGIEVNKHKDGHLFPQHNAALPFTRFVVGQADYTPILYTNPGPTTFAHHMATLVIYTTALQTYAEHPETMMRAPAVRDGFEVMQSIPTVWDETVVLPGSDIGRLAAFARRTGEEWFVGILNGGEARDYAFDLSFLDAGSYEAVVISDDLDAELVDVIQLGINQKAEGKRNGWNHAVPFTVENASVDASKRLTVHLADGGGCVVRLRKL